MLLKKNVPLQIRFMWLQSLKPRAQIVEWTDCDKNVKNLVNYKSKAKNGQQELIGEPNNLHLPNQIDLTHHHDRL